MLIPYNNTVIGNALENFAALTLTVKSLNGFCLMRLKKKEKILMMPLTRSQVATKGVFALESAFFADDSFADCSFEICEQMIMKLHVEGLKSIVQEADQIHPDLQLLGPKVKQIYDELLKTSRDKPMRFIIFRDVLLKDHHVKVLDTLKVISRLTSCTMVCLRKVQTASFDLQLTPEQVKLIHTYQLSRENHAVQVQLYVSFIKSRNGPENCCPCQIKVVANEKECKLPIRICKETQLLMTGLEEYSIAGLNITPNLKLSSCAQNRINVKWNSKHYCAQCIFVVLARELKSAELLQRLKTKGVQPAHYTHDLINKAFSKNANPDVVVTMLVVSLICPIGKVKMMLPCRGANCSHLQCFDAGTYLQMNEHKPTWKCPICAKSAKYANLIIDGYFLDMLRSTKLKGTEIQLHKDGSWSIPSKRSIRL